ncbi:hypothetical protein DUNSADRAFT_11499, partial [Dunaliella salina]
AFGIHALTTSALLAVHKGACKLICSFQSANQQQLEQEHLQQLLQHDEGGASDGKRSMETVCTPWSTQINRHPVSTKVLGHLLAFLSLGCTTLHAVSPRPRGMQAGRAGYKDHDSSEVVEEQQQAQAGHAHTNTGSQQERLEQQQQQQQQQHEQQAKKACTKTEAHQEPLKRQQEKQQQRAEACTEPSVHRWLSERQQQQQQQAKACTKPKVPHEPWEQQLHSTGAPGEGSSATEQLQGLREPLKHTQWSASERDAGTSPGQTDSLYSQLQGTSTGSSADNLCSHARARQTSSIFSTTSSVHASLGSADVIAAHHSIRGVHQAATVWTPAVRKALSTAAHDLARARKERPCTSNVGANSTPLRNLQEACRIVLKLHGPTRLDQLPKPWPEQFQHRLQRYSLLAPAVRSGCVVISYDAVPRTSASTTLEGMREAVQVEAKKWAQEHGLPEA